MAEAEPASAEVAIDVPEGGEDVGGPSTYIHVPGACEGEMIDPHFVFPEASAAPKRTYFEPHKKNWWTFPDPICNTQVRLTSFCVFICALIVITNQDTDWAWYLIPVVLFDFVVRTAFGPTPLSPFGNIATGILTLLKVEPDFVPSNAKRFSFFLGIILNTVLCILHFGLDSHIKRGPVTVLTVFSGLESIGGFCVGCWFFKSFFRMRDRWYLRKDYLKLQPAPSIAKRRWGKNPLVDAGEPERDHGYDFDLIVVGGGSGGLAACKEAARLGKKVMVIDYVSPSPAGCRWGLGGVCVCVGCIPKKLYHTSAIVRESAVEATSFGWRSAEGAELGHDSFTLDWGLLRNNIQRHIGELSEGYIRGLKSAQVLYVNAKGRFTGPHTMEITDDCKRVKVVSARRFILATGGRPRYPTIPGAELGISSDDIFSRETPPGKTLLVGASYISLETAGFLNGLGFDTTVMIRSIALRGFDRGCADLIVENMKAAGVKFIMGKIPTGVEEVEGGAKRVTMRDTKAEDGAAETSEVFDTVMWAVGRVPNVGALNLKAAGVELASDGKIAAYQERTTADHIYAIGDVMERGIELTPVAIQSGLLLAKRLYGGGKEVMSYNHVATTVFTPTEYSCCGMSEEAAIETFGEENIEVFHSYFTPLEYTLPHRTAKCYAKLIVNTLDHMRVIGLHYLGPNAGEVMQGFSTGMRAGMTKADWDMTAGIHPTCAEELVSLRRTKRSGVDPVKTGC
jgi:thioredoxin reductase (NADPH)